ncbi:hypothetical protein [Mongoliitalea daihaiensis]|uniref:hypothetical protein n=1 Tax=Mongoliitalea daihaiensis TaxID=2782006 RepID=UPI001F453CB6|nr:hypothetical protein [Mongoliitalea daihaiensis]UJP66580.1 hypothetical protein IPZ59_08300 [Mongoliitalea daihaiensis]
MDRENNFEKKFKQKLEEVHTPYTEDAWTSFAPLLNASSVPFWKRWYVPYIYSTLLFFGAWLLFPLREQGNQAILDGAPLGILAQQDTLVVRDTVYIIDTLYVYKTIVVAQENRMQRPITNVSSLGPVDTVGIQQAGQATGIGNSPSLEEGNLRLAKNTTNAQNPPTSTVGGSKRETMNRGGSEAISSVPTTTIDTVANERMPASGGLGSNVLMAPSIAPEEGFVMKLEKELVVGDTSNLKNNYDQSKHKPFVNLEAGLSLMLPVSRNIDYYAASLQGFQVGLEWDNGWGIYTGVMRNSMRGEIDDDDIARFSPTVLDQLPGRPADMTVVDEIYVTNRQWLFPLELRWRSMYFSGFSFESSAGIVANLLRRQDFQYEFDGRVELEDQFETLQKNQFMLSHVKIGLGTNYLLSQRMGMYLRTHYWFPTTGTGILQNRVHGLEVGVGMNYFLGR